VAGVYDDVISVVMRDRKTWACSLVHLDASSWKVTKTWPMPACIKSPKLLADGRVVGVAEITGPGDIPGDDEVVVWEPGAESLFQLTQGAYREELVHPTRDGKKLVFNRRLDKPPEKFSVGNYRRVVCELELPEK